MKFYKIKILIFFALLFFISGCKKKPFNYRNKFTGDFEVIYSYQNWIYGQGLTASDTSTFPAKLRYSTKGEKNNFMIQLINETVDLTIEKSGELKKCGVHVGAFDGKNHFQIE